MRSSMPGPSLSPSEASFVSQHETTIERIASDLTDLYQRIGNIASSTVEDAIIARIRQFSSFTHDIEVDLRELSQQTRDLIHANLPSVVADFEGEEIPVLFTGAE